MNEGDKTQQRRRLQISDKNRTKTKGKKNCRKQESPKDPQKQDKGTKTKHRKDKQGKYKRLKQTRRQTRGKQSRGCRQGRQMRDTGKTDDKKRLLIRSGETWNTRRKWRKKIRKTRGDMISIKGKEKKRKRMKAREKKKGKHENN